MKTANKTVTATQLVKDALKKAEFFKDYNVFVSLYEEEALKRAAEIDEKIARGENVGRLAGVPFAAKDNYLIKGTKTTASSHILEPFVAPITSTVVKQLEAEGAILIGKVNMDSFAHGSSTENSYFGPTLNSHDKTRVAGGSSGGSAVAVALDIVDFTTGSDTGGSIRQPASFNGVYGIKPTYGATSRYGVASMASSLDTDGFFAKSAEDIELLMDICAHRDEKDMTTLPDFYQESEAKPVKKIGIIKEFNNETVDKNIRKALDDKCEELKKKGYEIVELDMPTLKYALAVYYIIQPAEVTSNLSRYDGIRYGFRSENSMDLESLYGNTRNEGFMKENKRRIMIGNFVLSSGFYDAYFLKAAKARTLLIEEYAKAFEKCDVILTPVSPNPAFKIGEKVNDPVAMYLEDLMSVSINLVGIPGLTIPVSETAEGLPIGLQILGPRRSDKTIINFAKEIA